VSPTTQKEKDVLVLHGPNLNMLGLREPEVYGCTRLEEIDAQLKILGHQWGIDVQTFQSNHEGALVDRIQAALGKVDGIIINPGAYTHTSIAIRDALLTISVPLIEVHISNIHRREPFRHHSMIADVATGQIVGLGINGYYLALRAMVDIIGAVAPS
jgi:3-dehydroquinate dehydratase II